MTNEELIIEQARRIATLENQVRDLLKRNEKHVAAARRVRSILNCVGGPLNGNKLNYSSPQLGTFQDIDQCLRGVTDQEMNHE